MATEVFDGIEPGSGFEKMRGGGMAHIMSGEAFGLNAGAAFCSEAEIFFDDGAYAKACEAKSPLVDEESVGGRLFGQTTMLALVELEEFNGHGPQGIDPFLAAFAKYLDRAIGGIERGDLNISDLLGPGGGVIEEHEDGEIADTVGGRRCGLGEQSLQLPAAKVLRLFTDGPLAGDGKNDFSVSFKFRGVDGKISEEGMNGVQSQIPSEGRVAAPVRIFEIFEKREDGFGVEIPDAQMAAVRMAGSEIEEQKFERIAVTSDGIGAQAPLITQVGLEEPLEMPGQFRAHSFLKIFFIGVWMTSPKLSWKRLPASRRMVWVI